MLTIAINQEVDVRWQMPVEDGRPEGEQVVRTFNNLIPACEFAVAMAKEGNIEISLVPNSGPELGLSQAQTIAADWETAKISLDATEVEI